MLSILFTTEIQGSAGLEGSTAYHCNGINGYLHFILVLHASACLQDKLLATYLHVVSLAGGAVERE